MNEMMTTTTGSSSSLPAAASRAGDVFAAFARRHVPPNFGKPVRYVKGIWIVGGEELLARTLFMAQVPELQIVCTRWANGKPTERRVAYVRDGADIPERDTLGDLNQAKWERGRDGRVKDPWSLEMVLPLIRTDDDELCCFFTSTNGGKTAIADLVAQYAERVATGIYGLPVIELQSGSYQHPQYGRTDIPVLAIKSWQEHGLPPPAPQIGAVPMTTVIAQPTALEAPPAKDDDMNDDIPF